MLFRYTRVHTWKLGIVSTGTVGQIIIYRCSHDDFFAFAEVWFGPLALHITSSNSFSQKQAKSQVIGHRCSF